MAAVGVLLGLGCRQDMHDQPRYEALEASPFFADGRSVRSQVEGTVARGELRADDHLYTGYVGEEAATTFPYPVDRAVLERGRERYDIFCSPCHSKLGDGRGMAAQRGVRMPPTYHSDRLREAPVGYYFDVISNGFGAMIDFSDRINARDRWAIIAYIRALQLSQNVNIDGLPESIRGELAARGVE